MGQNMVLFKSSVLHFSVMDRFRGRAWVRAGVTRLGPGGPLSCRVQLQLASTHLPGGF